MILKDTELAKEQAGMRTTFPDPQASQCLFHQGFWPEVGLRGEKQGTEIGFVNASGGRRSLLHIGTSDGIRSFGVSVCVLPQAN